MNLGGVGWILGENWWPYQRPTFVTPPFSGFVSGHSTFSRAAAGILEYITGSPYFPAGLGEFSAAQNEFLQFEDGPSVPITLQWASYLDAAAQCSCTHQHCWGSPRTAGECGSGVVMCQPCLRSNILKFGSLAYSLYMFQ